MDHKKLYMNSGKDVDSLRKRRRHEQTDLRKEKRDKVLQSKRVRLLTNEHEEDDISEVQVKELAKAFQKASSNKKEILRLLRRAFGQGSLYIDTFLSVENSMQCLVGVLSCQDADLQLEAAWCITNISAGMHEHAELALKMAAPYLITYLSSSNPTMQDQCAWALGNIAGDGPECRDTLRKQGILTPLVNLLKSPTPSVVKSAAFALSNMVRGHDASIKLLMETELPKLLLDHLEYKPDELKVISEVCWVLTYLTASGEHEEDLVQMGIIEKMVTLLVDLSVNKPDNFHVVTPLLRCIGNICSGPDKNSARASSNDGLFGAMKVLLKSEHRHIRKECVWALSNMTGEMNVAREVMNSGLVPLILDVFNCGYDIKKEASYCICNLACHGEDFCQQLLDLGAMQAMTPLLKMADVEILQLVLCFSEMMCRNTQGAKQLFEEAEGVGTLEGMEYHTNDAIRTQAHHLLDTYFVLETGEHLPAEEKIEYPPWREAAQPHTDG